MMYVGSDDPAYCEFQTVILFQYVTLRSVIAVFPTLSLAESLHFGLSH